MQREKALRTCGIPRRSFLNQTAWLLASSILAACVNAAVELPVLIGMTGGNSIKETRIINLDATQAANAQRLWLKIHNVRFDSQAAVGMAPDGQNVPAWQDLNNSNTKVKVTCNGRKYGGIGGGFSTVEVEVDVSDWTIQAGDMKFVFSQKAHNQITSSFRVLEFNLLDGPGGTKLINETEFTQADPTALPTGIVNNATNIAAGETLWSAQSSLIEFPGSTTMRASCADCHTQSGYDLQYFGYSSLSIIKRSRFHGLSQTQGKQIALYIRSLTKDGNPMPAYGRPWNPPYQPGTSIDATEPQEWAAGAGLEAVLGDDSEMLDYLFPDVGSGGNRTQTGIDSVISTVVDADNPALETYKIPVAIQMPDWNLWLPIVAPVDLWDGSVAVPDGDDSLWSGGNPDDFEQTPAYTSYTTARTQLESSTNFFANDTTRNDLLDYLTDIHTQNRKILTSWRTPNGPYLENSTLNNNFEDKDMIRRSVLSWQAVKLFELMTEFDLQDKSPQIFNRDTADPNAVNGNYGVGEALMWPTRDQSVHPNAPHISAIQFNDKARHKNNWVGQNPMTADYLSSAWYHLQMILNSGTKQRLNQANFRPVDWVYLYRHINDVYERSLLHYDPDLVAYEPLRMVLTMAKAYEARDTSGAGIDGVISLNNSDTGWVIRSLPLWRLLHPGEGEGAIPEKGETSGPDARSVWGDTRHMAKLDDYENGLWAKVVNAFISEFVRVSDTTAMHTEWNNNRKPNADRTGATGYRKIMPADTKPLDWHEGVDGEHSDALFQGQEHMDSYWRAIPLFTEIGCNTTRVQSLADWCETIWPGPSGDLNNWDGRVDRSPLNYVYYKIRNNDRDMILNNTTAGDIDFAASSTSGNSVKWELIPVSSQAWRTIDREGASRLLASTDNEIGSGGHYIVEAPQVDNNYAHWRTIYLGAGKHKIENREKSGAFLIGRWDNEISTSPTSNIVERMEWFFDE